MKPVFARQMEVYAGFLEHTDHHVGRVIDALEDLEILDDTLIYVIVGDNGASAEGTPNGCFNELVVLNGAFGVETVEFMTDRIDDFGTPKAYNHYAVGWAHALDTPYQWTKQVASHWGGTRNGTIVHWPGGIKAKGEIRNQFHHVIDVAATVLDVAGLPEPTFVHGIQQMPLHGTSMAYSFDDADADERRETQYFEMFCNRGIYHQGWTAVPATARRGPRPRCRHSTTTSGSSTARRLDAGARPRTGAAREARRAAAPLPDRGGEVQRAPPRRPSLRALQPRPRRAAGAGQGQHAAALRLDGPPLRELDRRREEQVPRGHGRDRRGGRRSRGHDHRPGRRLRRLDAVRASGQAAYCYNLFGLQQFKVHGEAPIPAGEHQVRVEFAYDGGGLGKGGTATLYLDGDKVGEGRVEATVPMAFSADETTDIGSDTATPVTDDLQEGKTQFTGRCAGCRSTSETTPRMPTT